MNGNLGLHIIKFPSNRFGFVGSIPHELGELVPADRSAVMGGRAFYNGKAELVELKFPVFDSEKQARDYALERGFNPTNGLTLGNDK